MTAWFVDTDFAHTVERRSFGIVLRAGRTKLECRVVAGAVPEMKNLDEVGCFIDAIVDQDGSMHEQTDGVPSVHRAADVREAF